MMESHQFMLMKNPLEDVVLATDDLPTYLIS